MKYDDAEFYFLNFETDLPQKAGGTHIGFYLAWLLLKGHADDELADSVEVLRTRRATGCDVLFDRCDGKLIDDDLDEEGNGFTAAYYEAISPTFNALSMANFRVPGIAMTTPARSRIPGTTSNVWLQCWSSGGRNGSRAGRSYR
jgi:hypothetical protein